jgi:hypothetical protein
LPCFSNGSKRLDDPAALGYTHASGPGLLDELFYDLSQHVESISSASVMRLRRALIRAFDGDSSSENGNSSLVPLQATKEDEDPHRLLADRVIVDPSTGFCARSGVTLRQIGLDQRQKKQMMERLLMNVRSPHKVKLMKAFCDWLSNRKAPPYTVIIGTLVVSSSDFALVCGAVSLSSDHLYSDGANVAYYMQNFERGCFNMHQIHFVVTALEGIGENPLGMFCY